MKNKRAAMEMSVGTIVTIVLLMTVLILGLVLVRTIFKSSTDNINNIDEAVKNEIKKLFSEDNAKKVVIYPASREISLEKGESGGFGFSIRNNKMIEESFTYDIHAGEIISSCQMDLAAADSLISLGKAGTVQLPSGDILEQPILVRFSIPESAPLCLIRYNIDILDSSGGLYLPTVTVDLEIK